MAKNQGSTEFVALPPFIKSYSDLENSSTARGSFPVQFCTVEGTIELIRETYKDKMIVYGVYNNITNQIYIGSSIEPSTRIYNHFISSRDSNVYLQSSIKTYGLSSFTFVVFSVLELSNNLTKLEKKDMIIPLEQKYLDMFLKSQLYNFLYVADSKLGSNHSEESRLLMSINSIGKNLGNIPANKGKKLSENERMKLIYGMRHRFKAIYFYDDMMNLVVVYESFNAACLQEKCSKSTLQASLAKNTLFRGFKVSYHYPLEHS